MLANPFVQHRVKHFDLLLSRELALLERQQIQILIMHQKFERSLQRDIEQLTNPSKKKARPLLNARRSKIPTEPFRIPVNDKSNSSYVSSDLSQPFTDETNSQVSSTKYRRLCLKPHRLPPIVKSNQTHRLKQSTNESGSTSNLNQSNLQNHNRSMNDILSELSQQFSKENLNESSLIQKQINTFMESLPENKGVHMGYDIFGPASLYSTRTTVAMK